jgi:hypothetical protein
MGVGIGAGGDWLAETTFVLVVNQAALVTVAKLEIGDGDARVSVARLDVATGGPTSVNSCVVVIE